jgi:hypothetical protein
MKFRIGPCKKELFHLNNNNAAQLKVHLLQALQTCHLS